MMNMVKKENRPGKVYVGNLPADATESEVRTTFSAFGEVESVWLARRPPGFGFVQFACVESAEAAVVELDGGRISGVRVKVELAHGRSRTDAREQPRAVSRSRSPVERGRDSPASRRRHSESPSPVRRIRNTVPYTDYPTYQERR